MNLGEKSFEITKQNNSIQTHITLNENVQIKYIKKLKKRHSKLYEKDNLCY